MFTLGRDSRNIAPVYVKAPPEIAMSLGLMQASSHVDEDGKSLLT